MKKNLPKTYEPWKYEDKIYRRWERSGAFNPDKLVSAEKSSYYSIAMPPPNVTGVLHLGHALENSIMDIQTRFQRMQGKKVLLVPGTDHAAVATQAKVEKELVKEGIKNPREQLGRKELLKRVRQYSEQSKKTIISQIKKMGTSCDWSRLAYTLDKERSEAVNQVFVKMFKDGLIEKDYRVINWSVKGQSTCSDDELEHREEKTTLYTFKYSKDFPIAISTTRPETKLGDTAVAVHPKDKRYKKYIGKTFTVDVGAKSPLKIKVIADREVDPDFGTGALGVTPAHSQIDFEMKEKNNLDLIAVIGKNGKMNENAGKEYTGLTIKQARKKFVTWLKNQSLLEKEELITHNVSTSDRFGDIIEPLPMEQWFVRVNKEIPGHNGKTLKDLMKEAVTVGHNGDRSKKIIITPNRFIDQYLHWIDNLRDWCISRQIWWGHQIPVWYDGTKIYCNTEPPSGKKWQRDPDTLDTWFSSGLWTFSTLGWPQKTNDFKKYHPTSWMQMGYEILFFWMARMILMSTYTLNEIPFQEVYIHGILRDKTGRKFSKSLGNGIDPIDMIKKYGTDALRLGLISGIAPGNDSRFFEEKLEGTRNLVNKIWNISRYILENQSTSSPQSLSKIKPEELTSADLFILKKMMRLIESTNQQLEKCDFSGASDQLRDFTWNELADWYLEISKFEDNKKVKTAILFTVLKDLLKLWHPFMPFVTEEVWSKFNDSLLITEKYPRKNSYSKIIKKARRTHDFDLIKDLIVAIRNIRAEYKIPPAKKIKAIIYGHSLVNAIKSEVELIKKLRTGIEELTIEKSGPKIKRAAFASVNEIEIYIPLAELIDFKKETARAKKELANYENFSKQLKNKLSNKQFTKNAPKEIVAREKERLEVTLKNIKKIKTYLKSIA